MQLRTTKQDRAQLFPRKPPQTRHCGRRCSITDASTNQISPKCNSSSTDPPARRRPLEHVTVKSLYHRILGTIGVLNRLPCGWAHTHPEGTCEGEALGEFRVATLERELTSSAVRALPANLARIVPGAFTRKAVAMCWIGGAS